MHRWTAAILLPIAIGTYTGVRDTGKALPGYRRVGSLTGSDRRYRKAGRGSPHWTTIAAMLRLMAFLLILAFVLLMDGVAMGAMLALGLAVATPVVYIGWHVLGE